MKKQELLGYSNWQNFSKVIDKAITACENAGYDKRDHFIGINKMVELGSGAKREIIPEQLPPAEDVKKVERRLKSEEKKLIKGTRKLQLPHD